MSGNFEPRANPIRSFRSDAPGDRGQLSKATLAHKSLITMVAMLAYFSLASLVIAYERRSLVDALRQITEVHEEDERQIALNFLLARAILTVNSNNYAPVDGVSAKVLALEIEDLLRGFRKLQIQYSIATDSVALLSHSLSNLTTEPSPETVAEIRSIFHRLVVDLDGVASDIRDRKKHLLVVYERTNDRLAIEWAFFIILGLGILSATMVFFLRKLAQDIKTVQKRATAITHGYRGKPLTIVRDDELGDLITSVNEMQNALRTHETEIELGRQQRFHKEKMAAIGSLAATIAHEINNPLSAIVGIAQSLAESDRLNQTTDPDTPSPFEAVMEQARRVMQITRQLGEFSVPQSHEPELIDINGLVRSTCRFVAYDGRFRGIDMVQKLDANLPAAFAVADHVVQVLMNLLINAADALDSTQESLAQIVITTSLETGAVSLCVQDTGCGITPENVEKVFDEHFTTKPPGKGSGLGLALCRALITSSGGDISLQSEVNVGTSVFITLPLVGTIG
jgi:two-component system NtrC family sensor kinase